MEAHKATTDETNVEEIANHVAQIAEGRVAHTGVTLSDEGYFTIVADGAGQAIDTAERHGYTVYQIRALDDGKVEIQFEQ
jgi:hypothetical protein